jgi:catechol 2,3-dioxygenase-like lactoylglutathione lyase family enzyme
VPFADHVALCPADLDEALRFYRDGIGLEVLFDVSFEADFKPLLGVTTTSLRTVFLGDRAQQAGRIELVELATGEPLPGGAPGAGLPHRGAFLLSFVVPVEETLSRLEALKLGGTPLQMPSPGGPAAVVVDPDGVMVELLSRVPSFES